MRHREETWWGIGWRGSKGTCGPDRSLAFVLRVRRGQCRILNRAPVRSWWYAVEDWLTGARGEARQGASREATVVDCGLTAPTLTLSIPEAAGMRSTGSWDFWAMLDH